LYEFFHHIQFILLDDIELIISKILDPAETKGNKNLSLEQLIIQFNDFGEDITDELTFRLSKIREKAKDIRERRNKRLSHYDLNASVSRNKDLFTKASRKVIKEILKDVSEYLNIIDYRIYNTTTIYDFSSAPGDAESLINCLKKCESYKALEKENVIEHGFWRTKGPFHDA